MFGAPSYRIVSCLTDILKIKKGIYCMVLAIDLNNKELIFFLLIFTYFTAT